MSSRKIVAQVPTSVAKTTHSNMIRGSAARSVRSNDVTHKTPVLKASLPRDRIQNVNNTLKPGIATRITTYSPRLTSRPATVKQQDTKTRINEKKQKEKEQKNEMISSTGTESSGVFSESSETAPVKAPPKTPHRTLGPTPHRNATSQSTTSRISKINNRTTVRPPPVATNNEQFLLADLRNEILTLKNQQRDHLEQLRHELGEQFKNEMAVAMAEKETEFRKQMEAKETAWRTELAEILERERAEFTRQREEKQKDFERLLADERRSWKMQIDSLLREISSLTQEKDRLEKSIRDEVELRVQATQQRYTDLQKEANSLQAVYELRCNEVRTLRQDLEKFGNAASEVLILRERNHTLQNTVEGLQAQLELKANEERRLQAELANLSAHYREELLRSRRLSMEKEELQWKLSIQNESSNNELDRTTTISKTNGLVTTDTPKLQRSTLPLINLSPIYSSNKNTDLVDNNNGDECGESQVVCSTPMKEMHSLPDSLASPTVRDFMEKNDSVAYVLDLGEHPPSSPKALYFPPPSPWSRRRNLVRFSSLRWHKSTSH